MKSNWHYIKYIALSCILVLFLNTACSNSNTVTQAQGKYTQEQVIAEAQKISPDCRLKKPSEEDLCH